MVLDWLHHPMRRVKRVGTTTGISAWRDDVGPTDMDAAFLPAVQAIRGNGHAWVRRRAEERPRLATAVGHRDAHGVVADDPRLVPDLRQ
jgi:hypothetical protein